MKRILSGVIIFIVLAGLVTGCATSYKAKPLPFKAPTSYANMIDIDGAQIASRAYTEPNATKEIFGFDIIGAGMLPVQVVFDNQGGHPLEINGGQSFLEDADGNLWPILARNLAYERATKYAETRQIFKEGAYKGFLGAVGGAVIGAAIGIVSGDNVAEAMGKGAAVGAAAGSTMGGAETMGSNEAQRTISEDLQNKSLQNKPVNPKSLAHGFVFFPAEAKTARMIRLQVVEKDTGNVHVLNMPL